LVLRPALSQDEYPPDIPISFWAFVKTLPVPAWDAAQTR
jgi:hypothetical protein